MVQSPLLSFDLTYRDIGVGLLESITLGLYRQSGDVLREYISNEIDNVPPPTYVRIELDVVARTVRIWGDGPGMGWEAFRNAVKVGFSPKDPTFNIGFRGIGIWAGVAACSKLRIATKNDGDPCEYELIVDCDKLREHFSGAKRNLPLIEVLNQCAGYRKRPTDRPHGTEVVLEGVLETFNGLLDESTVRNYLTQECPLTFEEGFKHTGPVEKYLRSKIPFYRRVNMFINEVPVRGLHIPEDVREPIYGEIKTSHGQGKKGATLAYFWLCHAKNTEKIPDGFDSGLRIRVRNFTVVQPGAVFKFLSDSRTKNLQIYPYWVGEIHAVHQDLRPNAERRDLEPTLARDSLVQYIQSDLYTTEMVPYSHLVSEYTRLDEESDTALGISTVVREKDYSSDIEVKADLDDVEERIEGLEVRMEGMSRKLRSKKAVQGVQKIKEDYRRSLEPKADRAISHLDAKRARLRALFEKKREELRTLPQEAGTRISEAPESKDTCQVPVRPAEPGTPGKELSKSTTDQLVAQVMTYQTRPSSLLEALIAALLETGLCVNEDELRSFMDVLVRVIQRKR